ncbi:PP2C family protein-serine/threonine phosphatase [Hazenella sp. IB182357]|uniref:PP2C family protein-serine/threonine phosphatase n=1 Tax=Polycladospora coralii TaxID=2771432 RepID=A0A926RX94_9BACL|nr:PP2C family protein-serine/threonine phosphatase [Polycladospora coralii]MBD1372301.1 PP2C family protein-serine/threonine phosphatase [Polycladospora coralii]MBS7531509.1 PP2C family protein-serine/threonine phosphatase [Polycladospora coralii]
MNAQLQKLYKNLLESYVLEPKEDHLYSAQRLSRWFIDQKIPPEELVNYHINTIKTIFPDIPQQVKSSFDLLLEVMISYGIAYQESEKLIDRHKQLDHEIDVAVGMQQTLLPVSPPQLNEVEIGVISVPANRMSGDYYNFVNHSEGYLGIAVSDIIGKGIPAALCMSMIKYAMDRLDMKPLSPGEKLRGLNTIVERNVDPSMFITMVYGVYDSLKHEFCYASAGHEPGLLYRADRQEFVELEAKGLVLGVNPKTDYEEYKIQLQVEDAIILMTDGVTECKVEDGFLTRDELLKTIQDCIHLPAQKAVERIHHKLCERTHYELSDDQTILIVKRNA